MAPHQERVIAEKAELDERIQKLTAFLTNDLFKGLPQDEKTDMQTQLSLMRSLTNVLGRRISRF